MKFADLFCGIGGFHIAAKNLGLEPVWACDIDKHARKAYAHNHGLEPAADITKIDPKDVPDFDLLFAGFPCQSFSDAPFAKQSSFDDDRGQLFFEIVRFLDAKKPEGFVLENVRNIVKIDNGDVIRRIFQELEALGYHVTAKILKLHEMGLPQKRQRCIFVGSKKPFGLWSFLDFPKKEMVNPKSILETEVDDKYYFVGNGRWNRLMKLFSIENPKNITEPPRFILVRKSMDLVVSDIAYTLVTIPHEQFLDFERYFTPRERLRLQGFPEDFEVVVSDAQHCKQTGNAVAPPMVQPVIERLLEHIS